MCRLWLCKITSQAKSQLAAKIALRNPCPFIFAGDPRKISPFPGRPVQGGEGGNWLLYLVLGGFLYSQQYEEFSKMMTLFKKSFEVG